MGVAIKCSGIRKSFTDPDGRSRCILADIRINLAAGQSALLEGPSGSGKSTLLNIISGLITPDDGEVSIDGESIPTMSESARDAFRARNIGYIFQTFNLISPLSVMENLIFPPILSGAVKKDLRKEALAILKRFGLADHAGKRPYRLSVGQRQRVAICRAILQKPGLLLADEPTASLDRRSASIVRQAFTELRDIGTTIIIATHDPEFATLGVDCRLNLDSGEAAS